MSNQPPRKQQRLSSNQSFTTSTNPSSTNMPKKKRKGKSVAEKRTALIMRIQKQLVYKKLSAMIIIDTNLVQWFCELCANAGHKKCGTTPSKWCETRDIVNHCTSSASHLKLINANPDLKRLNEERIKKNKDTASKSTFLLSNPNCIVLNDSNFPLFTNTGNTNSLQFNDNNNNDNTTTQIPPSITFAPNDTPSTCNITPTPSTKRAQNTPNRQTIYMSMFNPHDIFHCNIQTAMTLTQDGLAFLNYLNVIHRGVMQRESLRQMIDQLFYPIMYFFSHCFFIYSERLKVRL